MKYFYLILTIAAIYSCKKKEERSCWKGHGDETSLEIPLDSVSNWNLHKRIKYRIFQDSTRKLVIKGGENLVNLISAENNGTEMTIRNNNKCHFLRGSDRIIEVEIHYPHFNRFYMEPSDSVIFMGTIVTDSFRVQMRQGAGSLVADVNANFLQVTASEGAGDFTLTGTANYAELKMNEQGFSNATGFTTNSIFIYQNSRNSMLVNIEGSSVIMWIDGTGNVYTVGTAAAIAEEGIGSGEMLPM